MVPGSGKWEDFCQKLNWKGEMEHANKRPHDPQIPKPLNAPQDGPPSGRKAVSEPILQVSISILSLVGSGAVHVERLDPEVVANSTQATMERKAASRFSHCSVLKGPALTTARLECNWRCAICATPHCSFPPCLTNPDHRVVACLVHPSAS